MLKEQTGCLVYCTNNHLQNINIMIECIDNNKPMLEFINYIKYEVILEAMNGRLEKNSWKLDTKKFKR